MVVDILPAEKTNPPPMPQHKKMTKGVFKVKTIFKRKSTESTSHIGEEYLEPDVVEELVEEGSAMLSERSVTPLHYHRNGINNSIPFLTYLIVYCFYFFSDFRFDTKYPLCNMFKLFTCAVCQVEMKPGEGISIHAGGSCNTRNSRPWDGPFLCVTCQEKREAMEGKNHSGSKINLI